MSVENHSDFPVPKKLKQDAIAEVVLEVRFDSADMGEIVVGRLSDLEVWRAFRINRLPSAEIPESMREKNDNLRFQPTLERVKEDGTEAVRIGSHTLAYHMYSPYKGWECLRESLNQAVHELFNTLDEVRVLRIGLRYINMIQASKHHVAGLKDLDLALTVGGDSLTDDFHLGYIKRPTEAHLAMIKVAAPGFIDQSSVPADAIAIIDVDIFTPNDFLLENEEAVISWVDTAHEIEKDSFFNLIPNPVIELLKEE